MKKLSCFIVFSLSLSIAGAQEKKDVPVQLDTVLVRGFESNATLLKVPASISLISGSDLHKVSTSSLLPSFNGLAGVRMEERSPGSYRLSVRGSLLRSPFGVRNIKVYLDDFIFTDAGGNTYLNLLDVNSLEKAELVKGPSGSIYGAGTGGSLLLSSSSMEHHAGIDTSTLRLRLSGGRFGTFQESVQYRLNKKKYLIQINQGHVESDGFRDQSSMRKDNLQFSLKLKGSEKIRTDFFMLLSDLSYQTPGGLNANQLVANPRQSRPATVVFPSAVEQHAGIFNKTVLFGVSNHISISSAWSTVTSISSSLVEYKNPFITNYEKRGEANIGLRAKLMYQPKGLLGLQWVSGVELQHGAYKIDSSGNNKGIPDGNRVRDQLTSNQQFVFSQLSIHPFKYISVQSGISINRFNYSIERTFGLPLSARTPVEFNPHFLPRLALLIAPIEGVSIYGQLSRGYSSPTIAEVRPSAGGVYAGLQAEHGWNREVGVKLSALRGRLYSSSVYFDFSIQDAIVRQTNSSGAEYFSNAGAVRQKGFEQEIAWVIINKQASSNLNYLKIESALTVNNFRFESYTLNLDNFAGKKLTGVPDITLSTSAEIHFLHHFFSNINFIQVGKIPLNDANTVFAKEYGLWQVRYGWRGKLAGRAMEFYALVDNLTNVKYSLGNDLNAFGGRYYNPSPSRNLLIGCKVDIK
jgi:iron complex outermembrane receptor protein